MADMRKMHSALSDYSFAARGLKRPYARLSLKAEELRQEGQGSFPLVLDAHVLKMLPLNDEFDRLFSDVLTMCMLLSAFEPSLARIVGLKLKTGSTSRYWHVSTSSLRIENPEPIDVLAAVRQGPLLVRPCSTISLECGHVLSFVGGAFSIDGNLADEDAISKLLDEMPDDTVLIEWEQLQEPDQPFRVLMAKAFGFKDSSGEIRICAEGVYDMASPRGVELHGGSLRSDIKLAPESLESANQAIRRILIDYPELEYVCGWFEMTEQGLVLVQVDTGLDVAFQEDPSQEVMSHFEAVVNRNRSTALKPAAKMCIKELSEVHAERKGFLGFMYRNWVRGILDDYRTSNTTLPEKLWAHRRGFYSYRIKQYGLTDANVSEFLSDYDYKRLRPLNGPYRKWLWDKVSTYLVMRPFARYMPVHYCRIVGKGEPCVVPFDQSGVDSVPAIMALLELKGTLAVKRAIGSHGKGFHKLEYRGTTDEYYVDGRLCNAVALVAFFEALDDEYMLTEYVTMHPFMASLYGDVVSTVRIMAIRDDESFKLYDAYLRIGTSSTGNTDNLAAGGVVAKVDLETGELSKPERIANHRFESCEYHPDSGARIAGTIPYWDQIKQGIMRMCSYLFPLEYLGFDVVVTADGFIVLEINTHQDLHKYASYPEGVKSYLLGKRDACFAEN